ncbi:MAG TPA: CGNR zinc finger domain-containing protein [Beutenbergiaceae bacterium]|nr:CGNR zinc finger domain-containing protein [Beutenbergiaceae bacterium]
MGEFRAGAEHAAKRCVEVLVALESPDPALTIAGLTAFGEDVEHLSAIDMKELSRAATTLRAVAAASDAAGASTVLNQILKKCQPVRLTNHEGTAWHLHVDSSDEASWAEWFLASSALALAILLAETQRPPMGLCAADGCSNPFLTLGSGRPRRFCSTSCATRTRVASHRAHR